ncbi:hypothetical protein, partial [Methylobacterium sp. WL30]|uniref:hypothetical protein n=1 Tax=Methylobacterium sp. WL30 TaxID=2603895 RepID=UPI001AEDFD3A
MAFPNLFDPPDIEKLSYSDVTSYLEEKSGGEFICEICKSQSWFIGPLDEQIYGAIDVKSSDQEIT